MGKRNDKAVKITKYFLERQPDASSELMFRNEFELLVATILAAQCTDKRVNTVTPELFRHYPTPEAMSKASVEEIHNLIKSVSYPNSKSKYLSSMSKMLVEKHGGKVPDSMEELVKLPGVGRKTANVVLAFAFGKEAMPVDTHVFRVSHRLGLVSDRERTPEAVEKVLVKIFPEGHVAQAHHWLLLHGRYVCTSRKPHCKECGLATLCDFNAKQAK